MNLYLVRHGIAVDRNGFDGNADTERPLTPKGIKKTREAVRQQISFYASTRTYKIVLDTHGWGDVAQRLNEKAAKGEWVAMAKEITDEMLDVYTVSGSFDDIADKVKERYDGLLDRVAFYIPYRAGTDDAEWAKLAKRFNG
jgi:hypothetical protein